MLQQDYLMRLLVGLAVAIREALEKHGAQTDNSGSRLQLETAIGVAADMDPDVLLSLAPESISTILWLGNLNDSVAEYIVHALMLDSTYCAEDGYDSLAALRRQQAEAITESFGFAYDPDRLEVLLNPTNAKDEEERAELEAQYREFK